MKESASVFLVTLTVCSVVIAQNSNLWEFLIGPRLGARIGDQRTSQKTTEQIVRSYGYRLDTHLVASETGHILTLHRIPRGRKKGDDKQRPVALIHHGLWGSSDMWLLRGPRLDLPYILADSGYDVWLFNMRGNVHSRKHKFLDPDKDPQYWDFGIEEVGYYDVPVSIDYILNITNQKDLIFLGHSLGCSTAFIMCSLRPEYNDKIRLFLAMGPLANIKQTLSPFQKFSFSLASVLIKYLESLQIYEFLPRRLYVSKILAMICEDGFPLQNLCLTVVFSITGYDSRQFNNTKTLPQFLYYYPAGTSLKVMSNVIQYYMWGEFARNDLGYTQNMQKYNRSTPPTYDLTKVTAPVSLHYGPGDFLVTEKDVSDLRDRLPNFIGLFKVPYKKFSHLDFVIAENANTLLYDVLLRIMDKYR